MDERNYEAEARHLWEWAASSSKLRLPDPLPDMRWDDDNASLAWFGGHSGGKLEYIRFHVEVHSRRLVAVLRIGDSDGGVKEERYVPEAVTQMAREAGRDAA